MMSDVWHVMHFVRFGLMEKDNSVIYILIFKEKSGKSLG